MEAVKRGHLDCVKYLCENGCPWEVDTCINAVGCGQFDCLKFAHEHGCPWYASTCSTAAKLNNLKCLKYAHENGCPWDERTCNNAIANNNLECFKYAYENGCPCDVAFKCANAGFNLYLQYYLLNYTKRKTIEQTQLLAQEIIAAALHPSRMAQWIDMED